MRSYRYFVATAAVAVFLGAPSIALAQTPGNAQSFAIVGGQSVAANGAGSTINGNVGINPASAASITGIPGNAVIAPPFVNHGNNGVAIAASGSVQTLYDSAAMAPGVANTPANLTTGGDGLGNYAPGKYTTAPGVATIPVGQSITLTAPGLYIFTVPANLTALGNVNLGVGVDPCNVWWRTPTGATLNGLNFRGTVVANALISLGPAAQVTGRALTTAAGSVTLAGGNTIGGCSGGAPAVICPIVFSPTVVSNGTVGTPYGQQFTGSSGVAPFTFTVPPGTLPAGFTLTPGGLLGGTPTTAETQTFTVTGTDAVGCSLSRSYTVVITSGGTPPPAGCPVITLEPTTLPNGAVGVAYSQTITTVGGTGPFTFARTAGGLLPSGLTLSSGGVISGTPTVAIADDFVIRATGAGGCFGELSYAMSILAGVPTLPQWFVIALFLGLLLIGYAKLNRRERV